MTDSRRDLSFTCSRRAFFRALFQEAMVFRGSLKGGQGFRLSDLGNLPDSQLATIKPMLNPDCEISVDQDHTWSRSKKAGSTLRLFPTTKENTLVFDMFTGQHTLEEIGQHLAQEMGWDEARAFAHARSLFLALVERQVCFPKDPPVPDVAEVG